MNLEEKLDHILAHHQELAATMARPESLGAEDFARLSREYAELASVVECIREIKAARHEMAEVEEVRTDAESDPEMLALAEQEHRTLGARIEALETRIKLLLLPKDEADSRNAILEVRAGTGGDEAALFASELLRMYQRYAERKVWRFEILQLSETGLGGCKEAIAAVSGRGVFARLKFESGVHRVQRVPQTETGGRIHTSAATVAVLPEAEEVDIAIDDEDLRIAVFRARGPGGQSVNTTDSAVRITHVPTGIVVSQQDEKSQHKNKAKAMKVMRARLYERERERQESERSAARRSQVGRGDRSERVRTYNFPQSRVTDHRINLALHKLEKLLAGEALDEIIDALIAEDQASRLAELEG